MSDIPLNLPDKYRPHLFDDVIGQTSVVSRLRKDFELRKPSSLYLFTGPAGCGKTTCARIASLYMNCEAMSEAVRKPCLACANCKSILNNSYPDLIEINGADNTGIDASRDILTKVRYAVSRTRWRILILDECHRLSAQAWDVWLKDLENGVPRTTFIFCTSEIDKVPNTIRSRAVNKGYTFMPVSTSTIFTHLKMIAEKEGITCEDSSLMSLTQAANGSVRNAVNALASYLNVGNIDAATLTTEYQKATVDDTIKFFALLQGNRVEDAYWLASNWTKAGMSFDDIHALCMIHLSNIFASFSLKYRGWNDNDVAKMKAQRKAIGDERIGQWIERLSDIKKMSYNMIQFGYSVCISYMIMRLSFQDITVRQTFVPVPNQQVSNTIPSEILAGASVDSQILGTVSFVAPEPIPAPPQPSSDTQTFPERAIIEKLAKALSGAVSFYNAKGNMAVIFRSNNGGTVRVAVSKPSQPNPYILVSDIEAAILDPEKYIQS